MTLLSPVWMLVLIPLALALWLFRPPTRLLFALRALAVLLVVLAVAGLATTDVGVVRRRDGTVQLTVGGWPMYRFAGDLRPGQNGGHGIGGVWFAVTPTGAKAGAR